MFRLISGPRIVKKKDHSLVKTVRLKGNDPAITGVADKRGAALKCKQYPQIGESLPLQFHLRVMYEVASDGFIIVHRVYLLRKKGTSVCFFNRGTGQMGECQVQTPNGITQVFFYLTPERLTEIVESIGRVEDFIGIRHLTQLGPEVFQKRRTE